MSLKKNKKRFSKTNCMTFSQTSAILNEFDGRGKDGHDYHDQLDEIKSHHWSLVAKKLEKYIKERSDAPSGQRTFRNDYPIPF